MTLMAATKTDLGLYLRQHMREARVSQTQIGDLLDKSQAWVFSYLLGRPEETLRLLWVENPERFHELLRLINLDTNEILERLNIQAEAPTPNPTGATPVHREDAPTTTPDFHLNIPTPPAAATLAVLMRSRHLEPHLKPGDIAIATLNAQPFNPGDLVIFKHQQPTHESYCVARLLLHDPNEALLELPNAPAQDRIQQTHPRNVLGRVFARLIFTPPN